MSENRDQRSFWVTLPGILSAIAAVIVAVGGLVGGLAAAGIIGGSSATPTPVPPPTSGQVPSIVDDRVELQVIIEPAEGADFTVNPPPDGNGKYERGKKVRIEVLLNAGWQIEQWRGPVQDKVGTTAIVNMDQNQTVIARLKIIPIPTATPTATSTAMSNTSSIEPAAQSVDDQLDMIEEKVDVGDFSGAVEKINQLERSGVLDQHTTGKIHVIRGNIAYHRGEFVQAEHQYQLAGMKVKSGTQAYATLLMNQAVLWSGKGLPFRDRAIANFQEAREVYQELDDKVGTAYVSVNEGALYENDPELARSHYEQARQEAGQAEDPLLMGTIELNIGMTYRRQSDSDEALDQADAYYEKARFWFEQAANLSGQAEVELSLAVVEQVRGRMELARQHLKSSEAYLRNVDRESQQIPPRRQAQMLTFKADLHDSFGESEEAEILYKEALSIYELHPDPLREASTLVNYAGLLARLNRNGEARKLLERAREIAEGFADEEPHQLLGVLYNNLGRTYQDISENHVALSYYEQSRDIAQAIGERLQYAQAVENIGVIRGFSGDFAQAIKNFEEALPIYREIENRDREVQTLFNLYSIYSAVGSSASETVSELLTLLQEYNVDQEVESGVLFGILVQDIKATSGLISYRERLHELRRFYEERNEPIGLGRSHQKLANVEQSLGNQDEMIKHAREAEKYVAEIALPLRITVHNDLGFFLLTDSPEDALGHFNKAFDLAENYDITRQRSLALVINMYTSIHAQEIDCDRHLEKARTVVDTIGDAEIRTQFQGIVDALSPICR